MIHDRPVLGCPFVVLPLFECEYYTWCHTIRSPVETAYHQC